MSAKEQQEGGRGRGWLDVFSLAGLHKTLDKWEFFSASTTTTAKETNESSTTDGSIASGTNSSLSGSKKKRKKKKIKAMKSACDGDSAATTNNTPDSENDYEDEDGLNNSVKWGVVEEILFTRTVSCSSVPTDGAYPLGLGVEHSRSITLLDELHSEQEAAEDSNTNKQKHAASVKKPTQRSRSNSITGGSAHTFKINSEQLRVKELQANIQNWSVINDSSKNDLAFSVIELNKDINNINESRKKSGCSCKPVKIDSGTSKVKLIGEIKTASAAIGLQQVGEGGVAASPATLAAAVAGAQLPALQDSQLQDMSKSDLLVKAKELVSQCPLCISQGCECVANEVPCSMDTCGCLQHGYHPESHAQSCNNPFGRVLYNKRVVRAYRRNILESMDMCQNIRRNSIDSMDDDSCGYSSSLKQSPHGSPQRRGRADSITSITSTGSTGSLLSNDSFDAKYNSSANNAISALSASATSDVCDKSNAPAPTPAPAETPETTSAQNSRKNKNKNKKKGGSISTTAAAAAATATEAVMLNGSLANDKAVVEVYAKPQSLAAAILPFPAVAASSETEFNVFSSKSKKKKKKNASLVENQQGKVDLGVARIPKGKEWSCPICTLVNSETSGCCAACGEIKR